MGDAGRVQLWQGDCLALLPGVPAQSVALAMWSPPYHVGKSYEQGMTYEAWVNLLTEAIRLHTRLLIPGGFLVVNTADILCFPDETLPRIQAVNLRRQRSDITADRVRNAKAIYPGHNRDQLAALLGCSEQTIDRRLNGNNARGGKYAPQTRVHLVGGLIESAAMAAGLALYDRRVWVKDAAWENSKWHTLSYRAVDEFEYLYFLWKPGATVVDRDRLTPREWTAWGSRAVWSIPSVRANDDHPAKYPPELPRRVIRLLTAPGATVLDCFMGRGTTGEVAVQEQRAFIGIELDAGHFATAQKHIVAAQAAYQPTLLDVPA